MTGGAFPLAHSTHSLYKFLQMNEFYLHKELLRNRTKMFIVTIITEKLQSYYFVICWIIFNSCAKDSNFLHIKSNLFK